MHVGGARGSRWRAVVRGMDGGRMRARMALGRGDSAGSWARAG